MRHSLLAGLLLLAACGTNTTSATKETATAAPATAAPAEQPAATMQLDLTPYGAPVVLTVPAGTTAKKDTAKTEGAPYVLVNGPKLAFRAVMRTQSEAMARDLLDMGKKMMTSMGGKLEVDEPLAMLATIPKGPINLTWSAITLCPGGKTCDFEMQDAAAKLSEADQRAMFAIVRAAKPTGK